MTKTEAASTKDILVEALGKVWEGADEVLTLTNKAKVEAYVWQTIDEKETNLIADALLGEAVENALAAVAVRALVSAYDKLKVGLIVLGRFYQTYQFYAEHGFMLPMLGVFGGSRQPGRPRYRDSSRNPSATA